MTVVRTSANLYNFYCTTKKPATGKTKNKQKMNPQGNNQDGYIPGQPQQSPAAVSDSNVAQSYVSTVTEDYRAQSLDDSLEVHTPQSVSVQQPTTQNSFLRGNFFSRRKATIVSTLITAIVLLLTIGAMSFLVRRAPDEKPQNAQTVQQKDVKIEGALESSLPEELQGAEQSLLVNGDVVTRGSLKVSSGGYVTVIRVQDPTSNQTVTLPSGSGTICLDTGNCEYAALADLATAQDELTSLQGSVTDLANLLNELESRTPTAGVDTLNGQRGSVSIQGSLNRINVSTSNGVVTLSTPQNLDANANVQFGSLAVSSSGQITANTLVQTGAGNSININANNDMITFTAGGRVFQLPNSGGATQTICTTGASCASGGGTAVLLAEGTAQQDNSTNASIFINDAAGGNLIQLQSLGTNRLVVANDGATTVNGSLTVSTLGNGFVRSTAGTLGVVSNINLASADVTGILTVTNGGTGVNTIPANGVLVGNGTSPVSSVVAGGAGLCLVSTAGAPSFQACPGAGSSFNLSADSGTAEQVDSGDTVTISGGNNVTTSVSTADTVTVGTVNNPNFTTSVTTPLLQSSGALSITPGGALAVGATGQAALLQGSTTTITANGAGNDIVLNSADQIRLTGFNCTGFSNGGKLTTDASGNISCANDNGAPGGTITGSGTANRLALFTGANTVADSWLLQNGSTLELDNTRNLSLTGGNFTVTGTGTFSGLLTANGNLVVEAGDTFTFNGEAFTDLTGTGLSFNSGSLQTTLGTSVDLTAEVSGILPVSNGGTGVNGSAAANGQLLVGNGSGYTLATLTQGSGITITNGAGSITVANTLGTTIESGEITDLTITNTDIANGTIDLSAKTTGNYVATIAGSSEISVSGSGSNNAAVSLGLVADSIGDTQLAFNTGQHLTTASTPSFTGLTVTGGTFTVGTTSQLASLVLQDGNGQTTTLQPGDTSGNLTFVLPTADGTANQCIKTNASGALSFGDCVASIGGGGGVTGSGTQNRLSKFGAGGGSIGDSSITDDGTNVTTTVDLVVQGGDFTLGTALQDAALTMYGNGFAATVTTASLSGAQNYTLPDGSGEFCIKELGNCSGAGGGNAPPDAQYLTLALNSGLSAERTLSFNGTNFSVVDNGANGSYSVNTAQNINTTAAPSFAGLTLTGSLQLNANTLQGGAAVIDFTNFDVASNGNVTAGTYNGQTISSAASLTGTLAVAGLATFNGGVTVEAGDTLTFNGDAFTDLTGNGLQVTTNTLTLLTQSSKGLEVDGNGLSLIDCATGEVLKYNGSNQWACASDAGSGGLGDEVQVNGVAADGANFVNTAASGTLASVTWALNNVTNPDEISLTIGTASATEAGVVTTGAQTFAGNKTFNGSVILTASQSITVTGGNTGSRPAGAEGMVYYDTDTDRLMVYSNGKWQADRSDVILVAASNSSQAEKDAADYVATGTNDHTTINSAVNAANGGKVHMFEGTYYISSSIILPSNTTLVGSGKGTLITIPNGANTSLDFIKNSYSGTATGNTNITITNLMLDGNDVNNLGNQDGIVIDAANSGTSALNNLTVSQVTIQNFQGTGLYSEAHDSRVDGSTFETMSYGVDLETGSHTTVTGNTFRNVQSTAIDAYESGNNKFTDNFFSQNESAIWIDGNADNNVVSNNRIESSTDSGMYITTDFNTISSNVISDTGLFGSIDLSNANNNTVTGNVISNSGGATINDAIVVNGGSTNTISSNIITDSSATTNNYAININSGSSNYLADNTLGGSSIRNQGTDTIFGGQLNSSGNYVIQPAGTIELMKNTTVTGTLNTSSNVDTNGSLTVGSADQFIISNAGVVTAGTWQAGIVGLSYGGTNNNTYTTNGIVYSNGTALVSTAAGTNGQCLIATTGSAPTWASCTATTLQGAYDASSPATILLSDNKNLQFTAADTTIDPSIIMKLECTACGTGTTGNFLVQNASSNALLSIAGDGDIEIGTANNGIYLSGSGGTTSGSFTLRGTARNTKKIRLHAEYPSVVLTADGSNNTGTMTSGYDNTSSARMNYYNWTTTQGTNQDYDIVVQVPLPTDFDGWASNPLAITGYTTNTTNGTITLEARDSADAQICNFVAVTPGSTNTWATNTTACTLGSGTYTAGDYITLRIRLQAPTSGNTRVGNIVLTYNSKF